MELDSLLDSLTDLSKESTVQLSVKPSDDVDLKGLLKDHICSFLSKDELTDREVVLLSAMLQSRLL